MSKTDEIISRLNQELISGFQGKYILIEMRLKTLYSYYDISTIKQQIKTHNIDGTIISALNVLKQKRRLKYKTKKGKNYLNYNNFTPQSVKIKDLASYFSNIETNNQQAEYDILNTVININKDAYITFPLYSKNSLTCIEFLCFEAKF